MAEPNLLETGIYTVSEAAELVGATERQVRGWIAGYPDAKVGPILDNELGWVEGRLAFSFTNLMELRFLAFFANAGVKVREIRAIMEEVRDTLAHPHPFATNVVFKTDGRKVVAEIALRNGVPRVYDLRSKNYEMGTIVLSSLKNNVIYDPSGDARAWFPRRKVAPNVIIHPKFSFGRPVLKDSQIPTQTIAHAVHVEKSMRAVADWYEIPERRVREAVNFENNLHSNLHKAA